MELEAECKNISQVTLTVLIENKDRKLGYTATAREKRASLVIYKRQLNCCFNRIKEEKKKGDIRQKTSHLLVISSTNYFRNPNV